MSPGKGGRERSVLISPGGERTQRATHDKGRGRMAQRMRRIEGGGGMSLRVMSLVTLPNTTRNRNSSSLALHTVTFGYE